MNKIDENGWVRTYQVSLAVTAPMILLVAPEDKNAEILEVNLAELMQAVSLYDTRWEFFKTKLLWIWNIMKMRY